MTQRSLWLCLLMMVSTWAVAGPTVVQPLPFDHPQHAATFDRFDVACVVLPGNHSWKRRYRLRFPPATAATLGK